MNVVPPGGAYAPAGAFGWPETPNPSPRYGPDTAVARNLGPWRRAWRRQAGGLGQAHIACYGDSITQGFFSSAQYHTYSWPGQLAARLAVRTGQPAGTGWVPPYEARDLTTLTAPANDDRLTLTGTWPTSVAIGLYAVGYYTLTAGDVLTFGPVECDYFRISYSQRSGGGTWNAAIDGGSSTSFNSSGSANGALQIATMTPTSPGSHTLTCTATAGVGMYINCVEAVRNPGRGVKVSRIAYSGKRFDQLMAGSTNVTSNKVAVQLAPDLALLTFGVNESDQGTSLASMRTNYVTYVNQFLAAGSSVAFVTPPPPAEGGTDAITWGQYADAIRYAALVCKVPVIDLTAMWGQHGNVLQWFSDAYHPNTAGHAEIGRIVADRVVQLAAN